MRVVKEMSIKDVELWGGAADFYSRLTDYEIELLDNYFNYVNYFEIFDETEINDLLSFDDDFYISEIINEDYDDYYQREPLR